MLIFSFINEKATLINNITCCFPNYFLDIQLSKGDVFNLNILDTMGVEKAKPITESYYKNADCCLLVYDITNKRSFEECKSYYKNQILGKCKKNVKTILIGNKSDLEDKRVISNEEAEQFAFENNYFFMETSCLENKNIQYAFVTLIESNNIHFPRKINSLNKYLHV